MAQHITPVALCCEPIKEVGIHGALTSPTKHMGYMGIAA